MDSISLVSGPTPVIIVAIGLLTVLLSFRLVDGALIPYQLRNSYYLWIGLVVLAAVCVLGWRRFRRTLLTLAQAVRIQTPTIGPAACQP